MTQQPDHAMTSHEGAGCAQTNPVVVRRALAGLREAGIVSSMKGRGGGWRLARPPAEINLDEVQRALSVRVVALATPEQRPGCLVEQAVKRALDGAIAEAVQVLDRHLAAITLADLAADIAHVHGAPVILRGVIRDAV
jgi:DNA-binding IscR family transcriptional regulator